jgi:23S rRNA pseudouridine2605 synthase
MERLQKILSRAGIASRRAGEQLMLDGRVTVNGAPARELGTKADPVRDDIRVDGRRVKLPEHHRYILLNKPRGYVTTRSDPQRRPTVIDLLRGVSEYVYPVGRLDFESEGLLILTNDGDLAAKLTHPRHGVARVYEARVAGVPDAHDLERLARGVTIDGRRTGPANVRMVTGRRQHSLRRVGPHPRAREDFAHGSRGPHPRSHLAAGAPLERRLSRPAEADAVFVITIREGRNRQVRKMCDAIGHPVTELKRVAIGPIRDATLKVGHWRELRPEEVERLRNATATNEHKGHRGHEGKTQ